MSKQDSALDTLFDYGSFIKKARAGLVNNMGKLIAASVGILMLAVTFTTVTFDGILTEEFASSLLLLLTSSYIIYFSLEDAGEKYGESTEEYKAAGERYAALRKMIGGEDIEELRDFCTEYSERELEFRKSSALISHGLTQKMLKEYCDGKSFGKKTDRMLAKIKAMQVIKLAPNTLLSREAYTKRSELENPEKRKLISLIIKLIPSTVCMTVTVSIMLTAKEGMSASDVLNGILKLSALPLIGFRGYSAGYSYVKHSGSGWLETKSGVLEAFFKERSKKSETLLIDAEKIG